MYASIGAGAAERVRAAAAAAKAELNRYPYISRNQSKEMARYRDQYGEMFTSSSYLFAALFFTSLIVFVIFLILVFINYTIYPILSFSPNDGGLIPIPTASDRKITYIDGPAAANVSANINLPNSSYTVGADVYLSGAFMMSQVPRVILYRATAPVTTGGTVDSLKETYSQTNFIIWLDPVKNDLYVSVVTSGNTSATKLETTLPIENVPIRKVFRLAVVFTTNFVEIYINGKLERSMAIKGNLIAVNESTNMYSTVKPINQNVMLGNLTLWSRILTAREINISESTPIKSETFFFHKAT